MEFMNGMTYFVPGLCSSLSNSRELLRQYKGGGVMCHKDTATGIAIVTLNHVERKNALSGTYSLYVFLIYPNLLLIKYINYPCRSGMNS
jgi:hypothetical protein